MPKQTNILKEVIESMRKGEVYDFIASNYYKLSKEELADIIKELAYSAYSYGNDDIEIIAGDSLEECWEHKLEDEE